MAIVINGSGTVTGLAVGGLPDLTVDSGTLAVNSRGTVLQVVQATHASAVSSSSATYADTGLTAAITPSSTSSKILVTVHQNGVDKRTNNTFIGIKLLRGSTNISQMAEVAAATGTTAINNIGTVSAEVLDSPNTTSATTYKTQFNSGGGNAVAYVQSSSAMSTITLTEIAG